MKTPILSPIHFSPEQSTAHTSQQTLLAIKEMTQKLQETIQAIQALNIPLQDKSVESEEIGKVVKSLQENSDVVASLAQDINNPEKVIRKLEEVKSANLITNKLLKEMNNKEIPQPKDFPTEMDFKFKASGMTEEMAVMPMFFKGKKGDKGDKGDIGSKGDKGEKGDSGKDGKNGKDGIGKDGKDGRDGTGTNGKDGSPDTPNEVVNKVNEATVKINPEQIKGLKQALQEVERFGTNPIGYASGGANQTIMLANGSRISDYFTELNFSTGLTASYSNGRITITGSSSNTFVDNEVVSGSGTSFTLANTPIAGTVHVFGLGQRLTLTTDYSIVGTTITTVNTWNAGEIICDYQT